MMQKSERRICMLHEGHVYTHATDLYLDTFLHFYSTDIPSCQNYYWGADA